MSDAEGVLQHLSRGGLSRLDALDVFDEIGSTNTWLLQQEVPQAGRFRAALARQQTAGRGRDGKSWLSPPSAGLYLSLAFRFAKAVASPASLTLAVGAGLAARLKEMGVEDVALKWPNDVVARDAKLGGILTEAASGGGIVIGIGLNVDLPETLRQRPMGGWPDRATDLAQCLGRVPDREVLASTTIDCLVDTIVAFERHGFGHFRRDWRALDWLSGKRITAGPSKVSGIAAGIDDDGALLIRTPNETLRVISGSISPADDTVACA